MHRCGASVKFHAMGTAGPAATSHCRRRACAFLERRFSADHGDEPGHVRQCDHSDARSCCARSDAHQLDATGWCTFFGAVGDATSSRRPAARSDSVLVTVLARRAIDLYGRGAPRDLAVGQVITDVSGDGFCVHGSSPGAEYAIIPYYNSGVPSATTILEVRGQGISPLALPPTEVFAAHGASRSARPTIALDDTFELRLRGRAAAEAARRLARGWLAREPRRGARERDVGDSRGRRSHLAQRERARLLRQSRSRAPAGSSRSRTRRSSSPTPAIRRVASPTPSIGRSA